LEKGDFTNNFFKKSPLPLFAKEGNIDCIIINKVIPFDAPPCRQGASLVII
jgi:hypothetical protein